jgi:hypothetical protein
MELGYGIGRISSGKPRNQAMIAPKRSSQASRTYAKGLWIMTARRVPVGHADAARPKRFSFGLRVAQSTFST